MGIPINMNEEDRKKLPNRPTSTGGNATEDGSTAIMMVACPNFKTARECLTSGRWMSNHIYYPKNDERMNGDDVEASTKINVEAWVNSVVQAAGDVMERKFWGGGW